MKKKIEKIPHESLENRQWAVFVLPYPPSVNHLYGKCGIRSFIKPNGIEYFKKVKDIVDNEDLFNGKIYGEIEVIIDIYPPDNRIRDSDNLFKALFDSLTKAGVWSDDKMITKNLYESFEVVKGGCVIIRVMERFKNSEEYIESEKEKYRKKDEAKDKRRKEADERKRLSKIKAR